MMQELDACAECTGGQIPSIRRSVIPLRSLLPATGCASATTLPAPISNRTGLFHDPNVAGQGLMTVFNQGTLFAGWFSFDPQGAADDSAKQLWFTLQASNITGNPNRISSRIYRTLGARRDQQQAKLADAVLTQCRARLVVAKQEISGGIGEDEITEINHDKIVSSKAPVTMLIDMGRKNNHSLPQNDK